MADGKHVDPADTPLAAVEDEVKKVFTEDGWKYVVRLSEQVAVTFGAAAVASFEASGDSFTKAALWAAAAAGLRAAYGLVAQKFGDGTQPSVAK